MWRETDSWFLMEFEDGSKGYAHLDANGNQIGLFREDGTPVLPEEHIVATCIDDNTSVPSWYTPSE